MGSMEMTFFSSWTSLVVSNDFSEKYEYAESTVDMQMFSETLFKSYQQSQNMTTPVLLLISTVYPKKYAHVFCFDVLCCGYTLTDFPISTRLTSLALWQSNHCPSTSKATLLNMDKYFIWIHYERLHNHNKAKHNKTVCIFLRIYCIHSGNCKPMSVLFSPLYDNFRDCAVQSISSLLYDWTQWIKCEMKLNIQFQTSVVAPLKFGNGWVISSHTL